MSLPVLIVDKEPQLRSLIRAVLSKYGFPTLEAQDGVSALTMVKRLGGAVTLIVSSISMPGLDGAALARLVKVQFPNTPVLLMFSGATDSDDLLADAFLPKPFAPPVLADAVRRLHTKQIQSENVQCD